MKPTTKPKNRQCSVDGCVAKHHGKGYCLKHYTRFYRHGNPLTALPHRLIADDSVRFWRKVAKRGDDECWEWSGQRGATGYGMFWLNGKTVTASRYSYLLANGEWPKNLVLHSCDNPPCVNPAHLRNGTHKDNKRDEIERNRQSIGERGGLSKLKTADVVEIKKLLSGGELSHSDIAQKFGCSAAAISSINTSRTWKHIG